LRVGVVDKFGQIATRARWWLSGEAMNENATTTNAFAGQDRRRHRVYVTKNTEYHFRDGFCVAVRDRRTGDFLQGHLALRRRIHGGLKFYLNGAIIPNPGEPAQGEALYFATGGRDLVTSPLERVDRPSKELVSAYPGGAKR
jgi:hypothetical protein